MGTGQRAEKKGRFSDNIAGSMDVPACIQPLKYRFDADVTLSKIVCGILQDYDGDVLMNGENYRDIPHGTLSRFFGVAFQDFARYSLSVRENIGFGCIELDRGNR